MSRGLHEGSTCSCPDVSRLMHCVPSVNLLTSLPSMFVSSQLPVSSIPRQPPTCSTREFKLSGFHDRKDGAAGCPSASEAAGTPTPTGAAAAAAAAAAVAAAHVSACSTAPCQPGAAGSASQGPKKSTGRVGNAVAAQQKPGRPSALRGASDRRRRPPGVLFLNEADAKKTPSGVLHIPYDAASDRPAQVEARAQLAGGATVPFGAGGGMEVGLRKLGQLGTQVEQGFRWVGVAGFWCGA